MTTKRAVALALMGLVLAIGVVLVSQNLWSTANGYCWGSIVECAP